MIKNDDDYLKQRTYTNYGGRKMCEYCQEDFEGWYKPLDKNAHICVFNKAYEQILDINWYGHKMKININYCPMCR